MFISSIISQSLFISSGCNFAEKFRTKRDAVFCDGPTSIYLQKPASIQPRTSLSKFGGKFNPFFIRHLAGKRTERRLRGAFERGPLLGGCRDRSGLASSHQTWSVMIRKKSTISWIRNLSFLVSSWQAKTEAKCFLLFGLKTMRPLSLGAGVGCIEASLLKLELGNFCNIWQFCLGGLVLGWSKAKFCTKKRLTAFFKIYKICILQDLRTPLEYQNYSGTIGF